MAENKDNQPDGSAPRRPQRIRNISELARIAGVSAGTVSRALANKDLVNPETRARIQAIAREHGFRPNQMASRLRTQRTGVIGVVIPLGHERKQHISDPFFMTMIGCLADELTERGYDVMLSRVLPDDPEWLERIVDSGMLDGALLIGQSDQFDTIERVAEFYNPLIVWGAHAQGQRHCSVGTDNVAGGRLAAEHLLARGARNIAFFGDTRGPEIAERLRGAQQAVEQSGGVLRAFPVPLTVQEMPAQIQRQLDQAGSSLDGIVCASDAIAMATIGILHERGVQVPQGIAVTGYDDLAIATQTVPQLTTIRQDVARGAKLMVEMLMRRIAGETTDSVVMEPELVVRGSA